MHVNPLFTPEQLPWRHWSTSQSTLPHGWQTAPRKGLQRKIEKWLSGQETHGWQVTVPVSLAKDPSGHAVQAAAPERLAAVPTAHGMQTEASVLPGIGLALPAAHATHELVSFAPSLGLYEPAGHGSNVSRRLAAPAAEQ